MAKNNHIRKILMTLIMLFVMIIPNYIFANETTIKFGDVNSDAKIDISDLTLVLRHISATKTNKNSKWILSDEKFKAADINQNDKIDSSDMLSLLRYIAANKSEKIATKHKDWLVLEHEEKEPEQKEPEQQQPEKTVEVTSIKLNKRSLSIKEKLTEQLTIEIKPENATNKTIEWSSSNNEIATVSAEGLVTAQKQGTAKIKAKSSNGKIVYCTVTVTDPTIHVTKVKLNKTKLELYENTTETLVAEIEPVDATYKTIEWSSSKNDVATVDANGVVTALKQGSTTITAKSVNGKKATCYVNVKKLVINAESIKLNKASSEIKPGATENLIATIEPSNTTDKSIKWSTSNSKVATVDGNGKITAKAEGTTTITAKTANEKKATCTITVKEPVINVTSVSISKTSVKIDRGYALTLTAAVSPSNATDKSIKWSTSNSKVATVSNGKVAAIAKGTAKITATSSNGKVATSTVTVNDEVVKKLDGKNVTLPLGEKVYFLDTQYKYSNGKTRGTDCIIIESNGKYGLIDTATDVKSSRVIKYLNQLNIKELEFVLITHAHSDHIGGYKDISKKVKIKNLYIKKLNSKNEYYTKVQNHVNYAKNQGTKVYYVDSMSNKTITLGNFTFKLFNTADKVKTKNINENVNSVVALATVNGKTIYFAGDIQNISGVNSESNTAKEVQAYLKTLGKKSVDIYKAAHHSYNENNVAAALKAINPINVVVTNQKNRSGTTTASKRIKTYVDKNKGKMYYTEAGTVVLNISKFGEITFKKLSNYYK